MKKQYIAEIIDFDGERFIRVEAESLEDAYDMLDWSLPYSASVLDVYLEGSQYKG